MVATEANRPGVSGQDIVNHCVNDVLVQNARPLFFLDYVASSRLDPTQVAAVVGGMAEACRQSGVVLLGGETAEMPGVYADGHFDVAGTLVGVAERDDLLPRADVAPGDVLIGLASSGPHTNGYSLLRRVLAGLPLDASPEPLEVSLADALLAPHRSYLPVLTPVLDGTDAVKALVHITGGGLVENPPRILPEGCGAEVVLGSWPVPPLFRLVRDASGLPASELHRTLNMGIGMVLVVAPDRVDEVRKLIDEDSWVIGRIVAGAREVTLV
jgi:phosphoribosylaminoimidazole synthetase